MTWRLWMNGSYKLVQAPTLHEAMMQIPRRKRLTVTKGERAGEGRRA